MRSYTGINIQWPISQLIISGAKTIETRTYPIPHKYVDTPMVIIETPGKKGNFKQRMVATVVFGESFQYKNKAEFYRDQSRHCVSPDSEWKWDDSKEKWGWPVKKIRVF